MIDLDDIPNSRSSWARLSWNKAQNTIGKLLQSNSFMKFEEKKLSQSNRADLIVIRSDRSEVIFGVIEVKTYKNLTSTIINQANQQVCRYLVNFFENVKEKNRWGKKQLKFFGCVVYTNDYPSTGGIINTEKLKTLISEEMLQDHLQCVFSCRPEELIALLQKHNLLRFPQDTLVNHFE